jgi:hypothetical protein
MCEVVVGLQLCNLQEPFVSEGTTGRHSMSVV